MPDTIIRRAVLEDAEALAALGRATFIESFEQYYTAEDLAVFLGEAHSAERYRRDLTDPTRAIFVVETDGVVVGYALVGPCSLPHAEVTADCGELHRIYLLAAHQGGGRGSRLFATALDWLERNGPRDVWLGVYSLNLGAQRFYERLGFEKVGDYDFIVGKQRDHEFILRRKARL